MMFETFIQNLNESELEDYIIDALDMDDGADTEIVLEDWEYHLNREAPQINLTQLQSLIKEYNKGNWSIDWEVSKPHETMIQLLLLDYLNLE